jgi:hypothetical protein
VVRLKGVNTEAEVKFEGVSGCVFGVCCFVCAWGCLGNVSRALLAMRRLLVGQRAGDKG